MEEHPANLIPTNITEIMQSAYIDYSMSVIISRALPDARDGLKPVQRRVLYAMLREGLLYNRAYDKCAGVVGEVLKNYHPHGDGSVYDALVRMAQPWVMRYPLIDGQGNFGSVDGDAPAAYRYTECRLMQIAEEMLKNIDEDTVDFIPNYKESTTEPSVLPAALPLLLMNGSTGIAVGMTTNIPPHNVGELIDATCSIIDQPNITVEEIMGIIKGPDFPTGGSIYGSKGIESYMKTGRGIVRMRGTLSVEEMENGDKEQIIISQIPYYLNRASLVTKIADLIKDQQFTEISDLRDESDENTRVVIELKRGEIPRVVINKLYKLTPLESSFGVILLALDQRRPKQMNIKEMIECFIDHRRDVIYRRTSFRLRKAQNRAHILEGYLLALDNMDDFVKVIRASSNREDAKKSLMAKYPISERQTNAILDLRLYQLTGMEKGKIQTEYDELMKIIASLKEILGSEPKLLEVIKNELTDLREKYASERVTELHPDEGEFRMEDIIPNTGCMITVTKNGFIKRTSLESFRAQKRGGKGVMGAAQHTEDKIEHLFSASTHDNIMFIMKSGKVFIEKVYDIPEGSRISKGRSIANLLSAEKEDEIASMITFQQMEDGKSLFLCTKFGIIKKTELIQYKNKRREGLKGIVLDEGDYVISAKLVVDEDEILILSKQGSSIRFRNSNIRSQGRVTRGVRGIRLKKEDTVVTMEIVDNEKTLLIAGSNGIGMRANFDNWKEQNRGGQGVIAMKTNEISGALPVANEDQIMLLTKKGIAVRTPIKDVRITSRASKGVKLIDLASRDKLIGISKVIETEEDDMANNDEFHPEKETLDSTSDSSAEIDPQE
jgi:DNA gyrase subunit A